MEQKFYNIFGVKEPPTGLLSGILSRINDLKKIKKLKLHIVIMTPLLLGATVLSAYLYQLLSVTLNESGFIYYSSMIFSDSSTVFSNIGIYLSLIAESAPTITIGLFLTAVFLFIKVMEYVTRDSKTLYKLSKNKHQKYAN